MGTVQGIFKQFTPELRRYAFLLTGSSERGGDLVEACLRAAVRNPRQTRLKSAEASIGYSTTPIRSFRNYSTAPVPQAR